MSSEQDDALRLADRLDLYATGDAHQQDIEQAAAELRRLRQSEREGWRYAKELEAEAASLRDQNSELDRKLAEMERAGKQALEALDCIYSPLHVREINKVGAAMTALRQALGDKPGEKSS